MLFQRYHSSTANQWLQNEWLLDEEFDAAVEDALATVDQDERFAKYYELQDYIAELAPSLFLYDQVEKHGFQRLCRLACISQRNQSGPRLLLLCTPYSGQSALSVSWSEFDKQIAVTLRGLPVFQLCSE